MRWASTVARRSAAARRSSGVGPSSTGAQRASRPPRPALVPTTSASRARPSTGPGSGPGTPRSSQNRVNSSKPVGWRISITANGVAVSVIPLTMPPNARCSTNQPAVRRRAAQDRAGPVATSSARAGAQSARAAAPSSARTVGTSAVAAAIGSEAARAAK